MLIIFFRKQETIEIIVKLDMTQNDLADFFGVARPSVARALGDLEEEGFIEARGKNIKILDREGLRILLKLIGRLIIL